MFRCYIHCNLGPGFPPAGRGPTRGPTPEVWASAKGIVEPFAVGDRAEHQRMERRFEVADYLSHGPSPHCSNTGPRSRFMRVVGMDRDASLSWMEVVQRALVIPLTSQNARAPHGPANVEHRRQQIDHCVLGHRVIPTQLLAKLRYANHLDKCGFRQSRKAGSSPAHTSHQM
jgi:hypothetical protein